MPDAIKVFRSKFCTLIYNDLPGEGGITVSVVDPAVEIPVTMTFSSVGVAVNVGELNLADEPGRGDHAAGETVAVLSAETGVSIEAPAVTITAETVTVTGATSFIGATNVEGTFDVAGVTTLEPEANVTGDLNVSGVSCVEGDANVGGVLAVEGESNFLGVVTVEGDRTFLAPSPRRATSGWSAGSRSPATSPAGCSWVRSCPPRSRDRAALPGVSAPRRWRGQTARAGSARALAEQRIVQLLFTNPGERLNRPTLGAG